ncbi:hypothetical protein BOSEA31B_13543 [Hyphomicrobiales bacterium]|nr:hypothetical protein BOSEA31B_13543 [Hyphomicrobiales bacterium]CAH1699314.1 hypothetical protein BOSEA1005_12367 [Hyphomicrobiales bacterium]CAI0343101.1 hypothetical protein BO1005MUT1_210166 [Hyphomicrobiales bacterium]
MAHQRAARWTLSPRCGSLPCLIRTYWEGSPSQSTINITRLTTMMTTAGSATHGAMASATVGGALPPKFQHAVNDDNNAIKLDQPKVRRVISKARCFIESSLKSSQRLVVSRGVA